MYNILICDDEKDIVSALSIYLSTENYNIFTAYTGQEALDIVAKHDIHLILMDIMMPQMDGIAATVKLRETSNIPHYPADCKERGQRQNFGAEYRGG